MDSSKLPIIRNREVRACRQCRASKLGCDKARPRCSRCLERNLRCVYIEVATSAGESIDESVMVDEASSWIKSGSLVSGTTNKSCANCICGKADIIPPVNHSDPGIAVSRTRNREPKSCTRCRQLKVRCNRLLPCGRCIRQRREKECSYGGEQTTPNTFNKQSRFHSDTHWRAIKSDIENILSRQVCSGACPVPVGEDFNLHNNFPFEWRGASGTFSRRAVLARLPDDSVVDTLIECFLETINLTHRVLYIPSWRKQLADFRLHPDKADLSWIGLLCMVLALGAHITNLTTTAEDRITRRRLVEPFLEAAQMCLFQTAFLYRPDVANIQSLCLMAVMKQLARMSCQEMDSCWTLIGLVVRMSLGIGLHRRSTPEHCLLWPFIAYLDLQQSLTSGMPAMLRLCDFNTALQAHAPSEDSPNSGLSTPDELTLTPSIEAPQSPFQDYRAAVFPHVATILEEKHARGGDATYEEIMLRDEQLRQILRTADKGCLFANGRIDPEHFSLSIFVRRALLALHYPVACRPYSFIQYPACYWSSLESCLAILAQQRKLCEHQTESQNYQWLSNMFKEDFFTAALTLCHHMLQDEAPVEASPDCQSEVHPKETILETLRSCREIWDREKKSSHCQSMAYGVFDAFLTTIEQNV